MSITPRIPSLIPETAPFTPEQRTWLNGLFAGMISLDESVTPLTNAEAAKLLPGVVAPAPEEDDGAPWHDPAMPLPDRMKLAEGKPLPRRMMAAMAQQDCSQCGYNCKDYADALFTKKEERLNLCVPGGKDTARMLKNLYAELGAAPPWRRPKQRPAPVVRARPLTRQSGARHFLSRAAASTKKARKRKPGTSSSILPKAGSITRSATVSASIRPTMPALVEAVIAALDAPADFPIGGRTLREVLTDGVSLSPAPDMLFQLISYLTGGDRKKKAKALAAGQDPDGDAATLDVLAALQKFPGIRPDPEAFIESLDALQPRVYSISSSLKCNPGRVSLTVDAVRYKVGEAHPARRRLDLPRRPRRARRQDQGLCAEGAAFRAAGRSGQADHHDRTRAPAGAVPRLPAGAAGDRRARPQLALFRPSAQRLRFLLRRRTEGDALRPAC